VAPSLLASPSIDLELNYAQSSRAMVFDGRSASLKVGGGGVNINLPVWQVGQITLGYGYGYSPNESASFLSATAAGSAESNYTFIAYEKTFLINDRWSVTPFLSKKDYLLKGDLKGELRGESLLVKVSSDIGFRDVGLRFDYTLSTITSIYFSATKLNWTLTSFANGQLSSGVTASTQVDADKDTFRFALGYKDVFFGMPMYVEYSQATLKSDVSGDLSQLKLGIELFRFQ